jgi:hypothetical protein
MVAEDTIHLLKECDAGTKMGVVSIDDVLDIVKDETLKKLLTESKDHHSKLGNDLHSLLNEYGSEEKDPNPIAKGMSWFKTNMKITMKNSDSTIADLITDGCDMGVKSLHKYMNQYRNEDKKAVDICKRLISIEEDLRDKLRVYL